MQTKLLLNNNHKISLNKSEVKTDILNDDS